MRLLVFSPGLCRRTIDSKIYNSSAPAEETDGLGQPITSSQLMLPGTHGRAFVLSLISSFSPLLQEPSESKVLLISFAMNMAPALPFSERGLLRSRFRD